MWSESTVYTVDGREDARIMAKYRYVGTAVAIIIVYIGVSMGTGLTITAGAAPVSAGNFTNASTLFRQSLAVMQHAVHQIHGSATIKTTNCCPKTAATARVTGDCATAGSHFFAHIAEEGAYINGTKRERVHNQFILESVSPRSFRAWIRSTATHDTWQVAPKTGVPTHYMDLAPYACPPMLISQFKQHMPPGLVNLGTSTLRGVAIWHLRQRIAPTKGGFKGTVMQQDFYVERSTRRWLRYESIYTTNGWGQHVQATYSRINVLVSAVPPTVGSSTP